MAIDTATKRFSMIGFSESINVHVLPAGALGKPGRATLIDIYSGITLGSVVNGTPQLFSADSIILETLTNDSIMNTTFTADSEVES